MTQSPTVPRVLALRHRTRRARFAPALVLLAGLSIGCASSGNSPADAAQLPDTLSAAQRDDLVRTLDAQTRRYFAHFGNREGAPYDSALAAFRSAASRSASRLAFDSAAYRFTAWLSQGHTHFSDPWLTARFGQPLGFALEPRAGGWLVRASDVAGLVRGDVVTHVDQEPIESFYATRRELIDFGAEHQRRRRLGRNSVWWPMQFSLTTADGRTIAVDRRRNPAPATTAPTVPHRWLVQDSVAYVRIAGFDPSLYADSAVAAIRGRYMSAAAIVVDVRGNGGGNTPMGLMRLLAAGRHAQGLRLVESKLRRDFGQVGGRLESLGDADGYRGSAIVLADRGCGSACEDFVAPFATASWARVIGDTTYGSTGQPVFETLPTGMRFAVAARRYTLADGRPFEDVGIPPHEVVPVTLEDVRAGRDPMLARALAWAREQVGAGRLR